MWPVSYRYVLVLSLVLSAAFISAEDRALVIYESELIELEETLTTLKQTTSQLRTQLLESKTAQEKLQRELTELSTKHEQSTKALTELSLHWKEYEKEATSKINHLQSQVATRNVVIGILAGVSALLGFGGIFIW